MKKLTAVVATLAALAAGPVLATTTWTDVHRGMPADVHCVKGAFTTTTEAAPTAATDGFSLSDVDGLSLEAEGASTLTAGGKYIAYIYNPTTSAWAPVSDGSLDLTAAAVPKQAWSGFTVTVPYSRIAWVPSGVGVASDLYICGHSR